jgi:hypothetical protein
MKIPYMLKQHRPRHDVALIANQIFKQLKFSWKQADMSAAPADRSRNEIHLQISNAQKCFPDNGIAASGQRLNTS